MSVQNNESEANTNLILRRYPYVRHIKCANGQCKDITYYKEAYVRAPKFEVLKSNNEFNELKNKINGLSNNNEDRVNKRKLRKQLTAVGMKICPQLSESQVKNYVYRITSNS